MSQNQDRISRKAVRDHFQGLTFPELKLAGRELDKMLKERAALDPGKVKEECLAYDREHPEALTRL